MTPYRDWDKDSGVKGFDAGDAHIDVLFKDGAVYRYSAVTVGPANLAKMISLAQAGEGLNQFINKVVKKRYERKLA